ncbi:MAG: hypothetical protein EKK37_13900 [Sphingobacteriales bacterium]|nr:MAG: hypothetical protein EKK37_13900 [Sphingobacteriales bacterium]
MKKLFFASFLLMAIWSCTKKATPAKSETAPSTNTATTNTETKTVVSADLIAEGKTTYESKCGRCHALHAPDEFSAEKWVPYVDAMAIKAKLTDTEKANVLAYVQANAKK